MLQSAWSECSFLPAMETNVPLGLAGQPMPMWEFSTSDVSGDRLFVQAEEFFGRGWMDTEGRVKLRFGRAASKRDGKTLNYFARIRTDHVAANDAVALAIDDQ